MSRINPTQRRLVVTLRDYAAGIAPFSSERHVSYETYWQGSTGDKRTPNYGTRKASELPFNAFDIFGVTRTPTKAICTTSSISVETGDPRIHTTESIWDQLCTFPLSTSHDVLAVERASADLGGQFASTKTNVLLAFKERKKTADTVYSGALRLVTAVRALKRGRFGDLAEALKMAPTQQQLSNLRSAVRRHPNRFKSDTKMRDFLANSWLEVSYGVLPTLSDIHGACEVVAQRAGRDASLTKITSRGAVTSTEDIVAHCNQRPYNEGVVGVMQRRSICKLTSISKLVDEHAAMLAQTGISNPALTLWDGVPLSFVVDWFLPVASFLERMSTFDGFEFVEIRKVQLTRTVSDVSGTIKLSPYWADYGRASGSMVINGGMTTYSYSRSKIQKPPFVPLRFKSPVSVSHGLSAIALLQSMAFSKRT